MSRAKVFGALILGAFSLAILYLALIATLGFWTKPGTADVAIVLGNEVLADGTPSPRLAARLDAAFEAFQAKHVEHILVSGGTGKSGHSEAQVMAHYLAERGVPKDRLVQDPEGINTRATAQNVARIMTEHNWKTAMAVSQFFHLPRTRMALSQEAVTVTATTYPAYYEGRDLYSLAREAAALPVYALGR